MKWRHLATRMFDRPLLLLPEYGAVMATALAERLNLEPMVAEDVLDRYRRPNERMMVDKRGGIAVIPVVGGMVHRGDGPEAESGLQSYTSLQNRLMELMDDRTIRGVLLDIDSGGGEAAGIHELAASIIAMQSEKPVWAIANTTAASAAYWLASSADRVYASPGARVGSIGVYVQHVDVSKMMEKKGIVHSFIYAGAHKVDGHPFATLPEEVRADIQSGVDDLWKEFADYVGERRGLTIEEVQGFEARVYGEKEAVENGLVDGVATLGEVLSDFRAKLNTPVINGYSFNGENKMNERLSHTASDVSNAREEGRSAGLAEARQSEVALRQKANAEFADALAELFPTSKRAEAFAETLRDGVPVATAVKVAKRVEDEAPKVKADAPQFRTRTDADVDRFMSRHSPDIEGDEPQDTPEERKERRRAQLQQAGQAVSRSNGFKTQASSGNRFSR